MDIVSPEIFHEPELLPALPELSDALPAMDLANLATIDGRLGILVSTAREKGFSEDTINSVFAIRERLYAERGQAWKLLQLFGQTFDFADGRPEEVVEAIEGRTQKHLQVLADSTISEMGRQDTYYWWSRSAESLPYLNRWLDFKGVYSDSYGAGKAIKEEYRKWLGSKAAAVLAESDGVLHAAIRNRNPEEIKGDVDRALSEFQKSVFSVFDRTFQVGVDSGIVQAKEMDRLEEPSVQKRGIFSRVVSKALGEGSAEYYDRDSIEYKALSSFFLISHELTKINGTYANSEKADRVVEEFKRVTGISGVEQYIRRRLREEINSESAFDFLNQFEDFLEHYYDFVASSRSNFRYSSAHDFQSRADFSDQKTRQTSGEDGPYEIYVGGFSTDITVRKAALEDEAALNGITEVLSDSLQSFFKLAGLNVKVVTALLTAALSGDPLEFEAKRVTRSLLGTFHPDASDINAEEKAEAEQNSKVAGALYTLFKQANLRLSRSGDSMTIRLVR